MKTPHHAYADDPDIENEEIVIQGAMDCVFIEDNGVIIVDFIN